MSIPSSLREYFLGPTLTFHHQKTIMSTLYSQLNNPRFFRLVVVVTLISFIALIVRVVRLKRQTGLLPFVMGGILIYSGFCLERSFRVGMLMEVGGSKWRDVIGVGGIRNSYVREKILYLFRRPKEDNVGKETVNDEKESAGREKVIEPGSINEEKIVETESMSKEKMIEDKKEENKIDEKTKGSKNGKNVTDEKVVTDEINGDKEDVKTNLKVKNDPLKGTNENETNDKARKDKMSDEIERSDKKGKDNHESTDAQNMKENTGTDSGTMNEEKLTIVNKTNGKGADIINERQNVQKSGVLRNKASENFPKISNSPPGGAPMSSSQPGNATSPAETVDSDLKNGDAPQETAETQSNKKTVYNDTLEQQEFLTSLKQTMLHKENALNRIKVLLSSLKKTRKYVTEDLKLFEDNFENFLKASAEVSDVLSNADISPELYKIDMHELKKDVWERIGVVDVLEGFLRITKGPRIIPKGDLTGSTKFYFENGDHLKEIYGLNDKSSVFNASLKENVNLVPSTISNTVISTNTDNKDNINLLPSLGLENNAVNTIDTGLKDRVMNLLPSLGLRSNALVKTFGANLKQNMVNLLPGRATNNPKLNNKPFSALLNTGIRRSAMYEPPETADLSATSLSNNKFETQKTKIGSRHSTCKKRKTS
ncbi:hypothetical protein THOM_0216 [Trachipleistophora hominis]|uniref:Uncharacterized protein n=1 Tax=Trachipleistophora hominis TaxID=72359 RepID=L7K0I2_TRAHO|nr:hypothetical protein THOM_0216 [Trachipleistophora hominis]